MKLEKYQQGDVLIKEVNYKIKGKKLDHLTLAEGEVTGHSHRITEGLGQLIMMDNILHLQIFSDTAKLKHQEHKLNDKIKKYGSFENIPIENIEYLRKYVFLPQKEETFEEYVSRLPEETIIPKGDYKIEIVKEYDHFEEKARRVVD